MAWHKCFPESNAADVLLLLCPHCLLHRRLRSVGLTSLNPLPLSCYETTVDVSSETLARESQTLARESLRLSSHHGCFALRCPLSKGLGIAVPTPLSLAQLQLLRVVDCLRLRWGWGCRGHLCNDDRGAGDCPIQRKVLPWQWLIIIFSCMCCCACVSTGLGKTEWGESAIWEDSNSTLWRLSQMSVALLLSLYMLHLLLKVFIRCHLSINLWILSWMSSAGILRVSFLHWRIAIWSAHLTAFGNRRFKLSGYSRVGSTSWGVYVGASEVSDLHLMGFRDRSHSSPIHSLLNPPTSSNKRMLQHLPKKAFFAYERKNHTLILVSTDSGNSKES